jgi:hypothetical protein
MHLLTIVRLVLVILVFHCLGGQYINFFTLFFFTYFAKVLWNFYCTRMKHEQCPLVLSNIGGYLCFWSLVCHVDNITWTNAAGVEVYSFLCQKTFYHVMRIC